MLLRTVELAGDVELEINQNTTLGTHGSTVWDCSLVAVNALASKKEQWQTWFTPQAKVLDLSCGTGVVGIAVARLFGSAVTLTDLPVLLPLIEENVARNKLAREGAKVLSFAWGDSVASLLGPFDVVVMSDIVVKAYSEHYDALLDSLWNVTHDKSNVLLAVELRSRADQLFFGLLHKHGFAWSVVEDERLDPHWKSEDIRLFAVRKTYPASDNLYQII